MEERTGKKLVPSYSYARIYYPGSSLLRHRDRPSCEHSITLNLSGSPWLLHIGGIPVLTHKGWGCIYDGVNYEHWRDPLQSKEPVVQAFFHYVEDVEENASRFYDGRPSLGLPAKFTTYYDETHGKPAKP